MKKIILFSLMQGLALFIITGLICFFVRGDFFFRYLAPIFGLAAGLFRLFTSMVVKTLAPSIYQDKEQK